MWLFKNRNKDSSEKQCTHKYKDFKWYIDSVYYVDTSKCSLKVFEPYVCIHCGYREDKQLFEWHSYGEEEILTKYRKELERKYKDKIEDRIVIEDEINDMILVDREYLKYYELIRSGKVELPKLE